MNTGATTNPENATHLQSVFPSQQHPTSLGVPTYQNPVDNESPKTVDHSPSPSEFVRYVPASEWQHQMRTGKRQEIASLTFFQRYFTKATATTKDLERSDGDDRKFSFLSPGSLFVGVALLLVLLGVVAAAVATRILHHGAHEPQYRGAPVRLAIPSNFPDPALLFDNGTWYAFGTNNAAGVLPYSFQSRLSNASENTPDFGRANIQMAVSKDFSNWTTVPLENQPLPTTGQWSQTFVDSKWLQPRISNTWAPAVIRADDGKYIMYYASARGGPNLYTKANGFNASHPTPHCVGVAVSDRSSAAGPFHPVDDEWICPWRQGGAIDPEVIRDVDGALYLVYKVDGNNIGSGGECGNTQGRIRPTPLMLQRLGANGTELIGAPTEILTNDGPRDGPLVEAPMLVRSSPEGIYFLFFSSGCTRAPSYNTQYATATRITGPYTRQDGVLLQTGSWNLEAPGSIGIVDDGAGGWNVAFHARVDYGDVGRVRAMFTAKLQLVGHAATLVPDKSLVHLDQAG